MKALLWITLTALPIYGASKLPPEPVVVEQLETMQAEWFAELQSTTAPAVASTAPVTTTTTHGRVIMVTATTTTLPGVDAALCGEWWPTAVSMGWPIDTLPTLDRVMYNESRCQSDAVSPTNDYGLVQVNWATWRHMVTDLGYTRNSLLNPAINLLIGRLIYQEAINAGYRCPWSPWYMSGNYC